MKKFINIDAAKFPIVVTRYANFTPSTEEFQQMQVDLENFVTNHTSFVMIIDLTDLAFWPSELRISQAKWAKDRDSLFVKQKMRIAFCTPSLISQMMLKGVFLISKPSIPHTVVSSVDQGTEWGLKQLENISSHALR